MHLVRTPAAITDKSVEQHNETEEWRIYPNPVNEELTIETPFESNWLVDIYTIDGKRVFSYEEVLVSDFIQMDIAFIPSGLYRIVLTDKSGQKNIVLLSEKNEKVIINIIAFFLVLTTREIAESGIEPVF